MMIFIDRRQRHDFHAKRARDKIMSRGRVPTAPTSVESFCFSPRGLWVVVNLLPSKVLIILFYVCSGVKFLCRQIPMRPICEREWRRARRRRRSCV